MKYEWDEAKNAVSIEKHGIDFNNAHELKITGNYQDNFITKGEPP